ncbi:MAG: helix-turn-helix domain-containing protein [Micrococcales bacterium]|nr:helix-turn-helix domain-containing protein [Micrococcales bacterium]
MSALAVIAEVNRPGDMIRSNRTALGWTQAELSARTGVSQADISRIESGQLDARWSTIHRLSEALDNPGEPPRRSLANGNRRAAPPSVSPVKWRPKGTVRPITPR